MTQLFDWNWCWKCQLKNLFTVTNSHHLLRWWNQIMSLYPYKHSTTVSFNYKLNPIIKKKHKKPFWHIRFFLTWEARSQLLVMKHINKVVEHIMESLGILRFLKKWTFVNSVCKGFCGTNFISDFSWIVLGKNLQKRDFCH